VQSSIDSWIIAQIYEGRTKEEVSESSSRSHERNPMTACSLVADPGPIAEGSRQNSVRTRSALES